MVGCGPQEEFRGCSDITISGKGATTTEVPEGPGAPESTPASPTEFTYSPIVSIILSIVTFLATVLLLALLYIYYYEVGRRVKSYLKGGGNKVQKMPPVPPPRVKRRAPEPGEHLKGYSLGVESIA